MADLKQVSLALLVAVSTALVASPKAFASQASLQSVKAPACSVQQNRFPELKIRHRHSDPYSECYLECKPESGGEEGDYYRCFNDCIARHGG